MRTNPGFDTISNYRDASHWRGNLYVGIHINSLVLDTSIDYDVYFIYIEELFTTEPTQQQMDTWLEDYLQIKEQGYITKTINIKVGE